MDKRVVMERGLVIGMILVATATAFAATKHPAQASCKDRDSGVFFSISAQADGLFRIFPTMGSGGYLVSQDILQSRYPVMVSSAQANRDDLDLISYVCQVDPITSPFIEVLIAQVTNRGLGKIQCLTCEPSRWHWADLKAQH